MNAKQFQQKIRDYTTNANSLVLRRILNWINQLFSDYTNLQAFGLWVAAILTGLLAVGYATAFRYVESLFDLLVEKEAAVAFAISPLFFLFAWWLVYRFAPEAAGSGIPQVMTAIELDYQKKNVDFVDRLLSLRAGAVKIVSSILCVAGGGAIGREGPTLQVSAIVFHAIGKWVRRIYPASHEQTWVIAGAAAGLASAFNTPLGGIVYAIEELGTKHFHRARTALISAVIISGLVAQGLLGSYLYLGNTQLKSFPAKAWPFVLILGGLTGLSGALFSRLLLWGISLRRRMVKTSQLAVVALICGVLAAALVYLERSNSGSGSSLISQILFESQSSTFTTILGRIAATTLAYLSGAAGGIFSPSLAIGAAIGSKVAYLLGDAHTNLFAMLGMIGFLTGVTHTPFTSFILVMEMSDRHSAIFPMMAVALIANSVAKSISSESFYETVRATWLKSAPPAD